MPLQIIHGDILTSDCDIIVNPTDGKFSGAGGVDKQIHSAAGEGLRKECSTLSALSVGEATVTGAYGIGCKHIIHTFGPRWKGGKHNEEALLKNCYVNSLHKAYSLGAKSVAFPLISSGMFGFPKDKVLYIAQNAIKECFFANEYDIRVCIYIADPSDFTVQGLRDVDSFIECSMKRELISDDEDGYRECDRMCKLRPLMADAQEAPASLEHWLRSHDDNFAVTLLKLIDIKGMTEVECYKKANISRKTFSKINTDANYKPSKQTAIAFAIALGLSVEETNALLKTAGFVLSGSIKFDLIITYCMEHGIYDIFEINAILFKNDQPTLGC